MLILALLAALTLIALICSITAITLTIRNPVDYATYRRATTPIRPIRYSRRTGRPIR